MANTFRYLDALDDIVKAYNNTKHRSIGMAPSDATTENEAKVFKTLYPKGRRRPHRPIYSIGDTVRLTRQDDVFPALDRGSREFGINEVGD